MRHACPRVMAKARLSSRNSTPEWRPRIRKMRCRAFTVMRSEAFETTNWPERFRVPVFPFVYFTSCLLYFLDRLGDHNAGRNIFGTLRKIDGMACFECCLRQPDDIVFLADYGFLSANVEDLNFASRVALELLDPMGAYRLDRFLLPCGQIGLRTYRHREHNKR